MTRHAARGILVSLIGQVAIAVCLLLVSAAQTSAQAPPEYSCTESHCYGITIWQNQPEYFGAYTEILQVPMSCPSGCGFIDNEIWLVDTQTAGCVTNGIGLCWVEAGYTVDSTFTSASRKYFFWADGRPRTTSTYNLHILGPTDRNSPDGTIDRFMIIKDGRGPPGLFQVWVYNNSLSTLYHGTSGSNFMSGKNIQTGQELFGSRGGFAGTANFRRNIWAVQVLGPEYVFWYNSQTTTGNVISDNPPSGFWTLPPLSTGAPEGGQFTTRCCS